MNAITQDLGLPGTAIGNTLDDKPWREARVGLLLLFGFFVVFGGWLAFVPLDAGVVASGEVKVAGNRHVVQHREGGVVKRLAAREGEQVVAGQLLLELAADEIAAQERSLMGQVMELQASRERLLAERAGRRTVARPAEWSAVPAEYADQAKEILERNQHELVSRGGALGAQIAVLGQRQAETAARIQGYRNQIASIDNQARLVEQELAGMRDLAVKGLVPVAQVRTMERTAADLAGRRAELVGLLAQSSESIGEARLQSMSVREDRSSEIAQELRATEARLAEVQPSLNAARAQAERARVRAPIAGTVVGLGAFNPGSVVQPGERILEIVPDDRTTTLQVRVQPRDADNLVPGQEALVHLSAIEGRNVPQAKGEVVRISADRFEDERTGMPYFKADIKVTDEEVQRVAHAAGRNNIVLTPGLPVEAVVPLRKRSALQYLLDPVRQSAWRAFRET